MLGLVSWANYITDVSNLLGVKVVGACGTAGAQPKSLFARLLDKLAVKRAEAGEIEGVDRNARSRLGTDEINTGTRLR
jgi:hypothetical protein